jgi:hypothetical protein
MDERGSVLQKSTSTSEQLDFKGGMFGNDNVNLWHVHFTDGKMYRVVMRIFSQKSDSIPKYQNIVKMISGKYGDPDHQTKLDMDPDTLYQLIDDKKAELDAGWRVAASARRSIECRLYKALPNQAPSIGITYADDVITAKVVAERKNDL